MLRIQQLRYPLHYHGTWNTPQFPNLEDHMPTTPHHRTYYPADSELFFGSPPTNLGHASRGISDATSDVAIVSDYYDYSPSASNEYLGNDRNSEHWHKYVSIISAVPSLGLWRAKREAVRSMLQTATRSPTTYRMKNVHSRGAHTEHPTSSIKVTSLRSPLRHSQLHRPPQFSQSIRVRPSQPSERSSVTISTVPDGRLAASQISSDT